MFTKSSTALDLVRGWWFATLGRAAQHMLHGSRVSAFPNTTNRIASRMRWGRSGGLCHLLGYDGTTSHALHD
jgi:hypothetical protein